MPTNPTPSPPTRRELRAKAVAWMTERYGSPRDLHSSQRATWHAQLRVLWAFCDSLEDNKI